MTTDTTDSTPSASKPTKKRTAKKRVAKKEVTKSLEVATCNTYRYCGGLETARLFLKGEEIPEEYTDVPS